MLILLLSLGSFKSYSQIDYKTVIPIGEIEGSYRWGITMWHIDRIYSWKKELDAAKEVNRNLEIKINQDGDLIKNQGALLNERSNMIKVLIDENEFNKTIYRACQISSANKDKEIAEKDKQYARLQKSKTIGEVVLFVVIGALTYVIVTK